MGFGRQACRVGMLHEIESTDSASEFNIHADGFVGGGGEVALGSVPWRLVVGICSSPACRVLAAVHGRGDLKGLVALTQTR